MLITEILKQNAELYGHEIALIEYEPADDLRRQLTWAEFDSMANQVAVGLQARGVQKEDCVVLLMMNSLEWLPIYFGILRSGAWAVPLNFRFTTDEIKNCIQTAKANIIIFGEEFYQTLATIKMDTETYLNPQIFIREMKSGSAIKTNPLPSLHPDDPAGLYFTSGTTGTPKAVLLTHGNLEFATQVENYHHAQTHSDNFLCIPPLYHTGAKMHWFGNLLVGARTVILKGVKPEWILATISKEAVTIVWLLVPWVRDILTAIDNQSINLQDYKLEQWRLMHIGAQPVPPSLIKAWKTVFPKHDYDTNYGLTEASGPGCVHLGSHNLHKAGAIGIPGFGWQCQIVDQQLSPVPDGNAGELLVRGAGVMREYYRNPQATAECLINGWLLTGDIAKKDADGFLWLVDRKKDVIISGGENIYPVEIENFILTHTDVHDVGVIGLADERLGEITVAVIQTKPTAVLNEEEIMEFCRRLPRYKRPRRIIFDKILRNATGKIEKPKMRITYNYRRQNVRT